MPTFKKSRMGWQNCQLEKLLLKLEVFYKPEWTKEGGKEGGGNMKINISTISKYKNECYKQLERKK